MNLTTAKTEKAVLVPYLRLLGKAVIVIILSRTKAAGVYPFGIAYAAALAEENVWVAIAGLILGVSGSLETAVKYILAAAVYGTMVYVRKFEERQVKAVALGTSLILASLISLIRFGATPTKLLIMIPEAFAVGGLYCLFANLKGKGTVSYAAEIMLAGGCLSSIYGIRVPYLEVNIAVFLASIIIMSVSYSAGVPASVMTGAVLGFMTFLNHTASVEMSGLFAISALLAALFAKTGKTGVCAGFLTGATVCVLCMGRLGELGIADIFAGPIIFLLIPQKTAVKIGSHINGKFTEEEYKEEVSERIKTVAKAVGELGGGVRLLSKTKDTEDTVFKGVSERVCKDCKNAENCFNEDKAEPFEIIKDMQRIMDRDGYLNFSNVPKKLSCSCVRSERFLNEFLHISELEKQNRILRGELACDRALVAKQYGEISDMIETLSKREEREIKAEKYEVSVSVCQEAKNGQEVNGDTVIHFKKENRYFVILCDGMGSGSAAREISGLTAQLFMEFFCSGIGKKAAVDMINSAIALNADRESFSSADILEIDMCTGEAEFLKIGSAQSFIKRNGEIEEVSSSALPIGILENIEVTPQKYELSEGDEILMITDGIGEATNGVLKNEWIKKLLFSTKGNGDERVKAILEGAKTRSVFSDDMTGVIIKLKRKKD